MFVNKKIKNMLITVLSFASVFIITLMFKKYNECVYNDYFKWESIFLITFVFGTFASIILHVLTIPLSVEHKYKKIEKEIVSTKSDTRIDGSIEGGLFYVRGKVDEVDYYFVLSKNNEIYKQEKVPVESTVIVETTEKPRVVMNKHYCGTSVSNWIRFHGNPEYCGEKDTIYVPVGTIENNAKFEIF